MIVIGADTHKRTHALAAVDAGTGRLRGQREIGADEPGHLAAVRWARGLDGERVWAIEGCRAVARRFEQELVAAGELVVRVAPHRMGESRKGERRPGKSDQIDALAIARAVVGDGSERFPAAHLDERAMEIRLLSDHRGDLVADRTRTALGRPPADREGSDQRARGAFSWAPGGVTPAKGPRSAGSPRSSRRPGRRVPLLGTAVRSRGRRRPSRRAG